MRKNAKIFKKYKNKIYNNNKFHFSEKVKNQLISGKFFFLLLVTDSFFTYYFGYFIEHFFS